ncbi:MAG: hypothetical protein JHC93_06280 [Parachlamydiales bacterium]|nr:hypothetical protein [Parachlamydiales bacterium]
MTTLAQVFKAVNTASNFISLNKIESTIPREIRDPTATLGEVALSYFCKGHVKFHFEDCNIVPQEDNFVQGGMRTVYRDKMIIDVARYLKPTHTFIYYYLNDKDYEPFIKNFTDCVIRKFEKMRKYYNDDYTVSSYIHFLIKNLDNKTYDQDYVLPIPKTFKWPVKKFQELNSELIILKKHKKNDENDLCMEQISRIRTIFFKPAVDRIKTFVRLEHKKPEIANEDSYDSDEFIDGTPPNGELELKKTSAKDSSIPERKNSTSCSSIPTNESADKKIVEVKSE